MSDDRNTANLSGDKKITISDALRFGIARVYDERKIVFQLASVFAIFMVFLNWPVLQEQVGNLKGFLDGNEQEAADNHPYYQIFTWLPAMLLNAIIMVIWSRVANIGPARALEGGFEALFQRAVMVLWRNLCGLGWLMLAFIPIMIAMFVLIVLLNLITGPLLNDDLSGVVTIAVALVVMVPGAVVFGLIGIAIVAQSLDHPLTIRTVWLRLGSHIPTAALSWAILYGCYFVLLVIFSLAFFGLFETGAPTRTEAIAFTLITQVGGTIVTLIWLSVSSIFARAVIAQEPQAPDQ